MSAGATPLDFSHLVFEKPADKVKTINVEPIRDDIKDALKKYEDAVRGYTPICFERLSEDKGTDRARLYLGHRPLGVQVEQIFCIPDPEDVGSPELDQLTHFNVGSGRRFTSIRAIQGDDWRGTWRAGGVIFGMDLDGSEMFQLWRYWEDSGNQHRLPDMTSELDNKRSKGRIERITHDAFRYEGLTVSTSNKIIAFASNMENGKDTLIYTSKLVNSFTGAKANAEPFTLPSRLITPAAQDSGSTNKWQVASISLDDHYLLLAKLNGPSYQPLYVVDISGASPSEPELVRLPGATEKVEDTANSVPAFSQDPTQPQIVYLVTNAYGDFASVVAYDIHLQTVTHITSPEPRLRALHSIPWDTKSLEVSSEHIMFIANIEGWDELFVHPLQGPHKGQVIQIKIDQEGGDLSYLTNGLNGKPWQVVLSIASHRKARSVFSLDLAATLVNVETNDGGHMFASAALKPYQQAQAIEPTYRTLPPQLIKYRSFDQLEIPAMYYYPAEHQKPVPLIISIHGGPASQATSQTRMPMHGYLINELNCAVMYPNVRGSKGYGKRFMAADDVEKREDSVKDIGALLDHVKNSMSREINSDRIAAVGSSYGGYMTYACLVHYSPKIACGVATCPVADWVAFLRNTASFRRAHRRLEYGDERDPSVRDFLMKISPLNHAEKISSPLLTAHGENDSRVTVEEAIKMWDMVQRNGVHSELIVGEQEGHGFRQKSVIEYWNAARVAFLERWLVGASVTAGF